MCMVSSLEPRRSSMGAGYFLSIYSLDCCLRRCQARNRNPERAAAYIVQAEPVTEFDTRRLAAVLATNSKLDVGPGFASQIAGDFHQASYAFLIDRCERICIDDVEFGVSR